MVLFDSDAENKPHVRLLAFRLHFAAYFPPFAYPAFVPNIRCATASGNRAEAIPLEQHGGLRPEIGFNLCRAEGESNKCIHKGLQMLFVAMFERGGRTRQARNFIAMRVCIVRIVSVVRIRTDFRNAVCTTFRTIFRNVVFVNVVVTGRNRPLGLARKAPLPTRRPITPQGCKGMTPPAPKSVLKAYVSCVGVLELLA